MVFSQNYRVAFYSRLSRQNTHFNMHTLISKRQQGSLRKNSHPKCKRQTLTDSNGAETINICDVINTSFKVTFCQNIYLVIQLIFVEIQFLLSSTRKTIMHLVPIFISAAGVN